MATAIICVILIIVAYIGIRSTIKRAARGCCNGGSETVRKVRIEDKDVHNYPFQMDLEVDGMTCSNCKKRVENALNERTGVLAKVDLEKKLVQIHMKEVIPEEELRELIRKAGYLPGRKLS